MVFRALNRPLLIAVTTVTLIAADASLPELQKMTARFAPVDLKVDVSRLNEADRKALPRLIEAARIIDTIYLRQVWTRNQALMDRLKLDTSPLGEARLKYFWLNKGPWSDLD